LLGLADAQEHGHDAGYRKGDEQDWARLDYGGHKSHANGDSYAHGYAHEHGELTTIKPYKLLFLGDDHGHRDGW
jgi:hypothetical protein